MRDGEIGLDITTEVLHIGDRERERLGDRERENGRGGGERTADRKVKRRGNNWGRQKKLRNRQIKTECEELRDRGKKRE